VNAPERAVVVPSVEVVVQGAARRQVLGDRGPLAARAQDVHEAVGHLAQVDRPLVAAALGGRDQWGDQRPFRVGQVTWVAQLATVVATTVLTRPHQRLPPDRNAAKGITTNSKHARCSRMDTYSRAVIPMVVPCAVSPTDCSGLPASCCSGRCCSTPTMVRPQPRRLPSSLGLTVITQGVGRRGWREAERSARAPPLRGALEADSLASWGAPISNA
jgi:hypothetical protein